GIYGVWKQTHDDYLQLLTKADLVSGIITIVALAIFLRRHLLPALRRRESSDGYVILGIAMAMISMLLHSLVDFSLQIPTVGFLCVVLRNLLADSELRAHQDRTGPRLEDDRRLLAASTMLLAVLACTSVAFGYGRIRASYFVARARSAGTTPA